MAQLLLQALVLKDLGETLGQSLAGVTPRTLRNYDHIGLLEPESIGANGYRYYGEQSILRLQQILFYRELGLGLAEIQEILDQPDFDVLQALQAHKIELQKRAVRLNRLIATVNRTILHVKGEEKMKKMIEILKNRNKSK